MSTQSHTRTDALKSFLHSIRFRLTLWFVLILALVLATFSLLIYWTQDRELRSDAIGHLQEDNERLQNLYDTETEGFDPLLIPDVTAGGAALRRGDVVILADLQGSTLQAWGPQISERDALIAGILQSGRNRGDGPVLLQQIKVAGPDGRVAAHDYLFVVTPVMRANGLAGYFIMGSQTDVVGQLHRLAVALLLGSLGMLVIAFLGGLWLADRAMRPVASIASAARNITESDLGRRLNLVGRDELADLGRTFDGMISRLQAAFDRQRQFVADASHELRTPLTIINLEAARALRLERPVEEYRHALTVVESEAARMTRLVNDLMALARMDSGQTILQLQPVDLGEIAGEAVERMAALAAEREVLLDIGSLEELRIMGDRQYLLQMVSNLVENGVKYSGAGKRVRISACRCGSSACLEIADTGPGIPPEHLPAVFGRFYRVDPARSQNDGAPDSPSGSGLGLSIVEWIVRAHGGEIRLESRIGEGTTFKVTVPLIRPAAPGATIR